jgi:hypothetical protein
MKRLIIDGDPGIRKEAVISYGDESDLTCFSVTRQGDWHGPERVQLWCVVGEPEEYEAFQKREFIPHHLDVDRVDAEAVDVVSLNNELAV